MLFNAFLKGSYWVGPWCNWVFCKGQSPGMGSACRLDTQGGMRQFPGAAVQTGLQRTLVQSQGTLGSQAGHAKGYTSHTHTYSPIKALTKWHATVSLTCSDALYSGIAALIITRLVALPSQTKKGRHEAFPDRRRDKCRHIESLMALVHHKGATFHE